MPKGFSFRDLSKGEKKEARMSTLVTAIAGKQWDLAALCLLLGLAETISRLPADSIEGVLDVLEGKNDEKRR